VLRLAFLAPNIVAAIITGTQPVELTLDRILRKVLTSNKQTDANSRKDAA